MIFVAVGTQRFQFDRLIRKMDDLILGGAISDDVFAQTGHSNYQPRSIAFQPFLSSQEFTSQIERAEIVVTHSGDGSIVDTLRRGKRTVVVPRLARFHEHVDDHQIEIAEAFAARGYVEACWDIMELGHHIEAARSREFRKFESTVKIEALIEKFLAS